MTTAEIIAEMEKLFERREMIARRVCRANDRMLRCSGALDGLPRATMGESKTQTIGIDLADDGAETKAIDEELAVWRRKVEGNIQRIQNEDYRKILALRYTEWLPMRVIAKRMHYARSYAYDKLAEAKKELTRPDST